MTDIRDPVPMVDADVPRFNQALVALLTAVAFVFDVRWLVAATFLVLLLSWAGGPRLAPFTRLYVSLIRPRRRGLRPEFEPAAGPRFAQLLGTLFLGGASLAFAVGAPVVGWSLTLIVTALAALAATTRVCLGCILHDRVVAR